MKKLYCDYPGCSGERASNLYIPETFMPAKKGRGRFESQEAYVKDKPYDLCPTHMKELIAVIQNFWKGAKPAVTQN